MGAIICRQQDCAPAPCCKTATDAAGSDEVLLPMRQGFRVGTSNAFLDNAALRNSLPQGLPAATMKAIQDTSSIVVPRGEDIARAFFRRICEDHHGLLSYFNCANFGSGTQQRALAASFAAFVAGLSQPGRLDPIFELIAVKHCALDVRPHLYLTFHGLLMSAAEEALGPEMTPQVSAVWSQAVLYMSRQLIEREDVLYREAKSRSGGWEGFRPFTIVRRDQETDSVMTFTLKPADTAGVYFDFNPGQFVSVKVDPDFEGTTAPRHYTITSQPGMPYLQISVKRVEYGKVSNFLHDYCTTGHRVLLSPPFGVFTPMSGNDSTGSQPMAVFLSAGIGISAILPLLEAMKGSVRLACHVDRSEETFAFRGRFFEACPHAEVHYTSSQGRPPRDFSASMAERIGTMHNWYICGPSDFMRDAMKSLACMGVPATQVRFETFGPQLCPAVDQDLIENELWETENDPTFQAIVASTQTSPAGPTQALLEPENPFGLMEGDRSRCPMSHLHSASQQELAPALATDEFVHMPALMKISMEDDSGI